MNAFTIIGCIIGGIVLLFVGLIIFITMNPPEEYKGQ